MPDIQPVDSVVTQIEVFWEQASRVDLKSVIGKLASYGSLAGHADAMLVLMGREHGSRSLGTEAVIASYIGGKLNRIMSALSRGEPGSDDSWDDLARYAMMARYAKKYGCWP